MLWELFVVIIKFLFAFIVAYTFATYLFSPVRSFGNIHSRWHRTFKFQFSTKEFYEAISEAIRNSGIEKTVVYEVAHASSSSIVSSNRLYLQVTRGDQMFLICAAPFANGFFVSWWLGEPLNFMKDLIPRIPKIGPALAMYIYRKTFYEMDTDDMFKDCIRECVNEVVDKIANTKGVRTMSELESKPTYIPLKERFN